MTHPQEVLCIGSALWDTVGRHPGPMEAGHDRPGRIRRIPGGVALNIAIAFARKGLTPRVLTAIGQDTEGDSLVTACRALGVDLSLALRHPHLPTDAYMAVEGENGLIAAIADAHSLEEAGDMILAPMRDGRLGSSDAPFAGVVALDGNLTLTLLADIAQSALFGAADLRVAPASPGKAERLTPFVESGRGTLYVNREEANLLTGAMARTAREAAEALINAGAERAIVTDGLAEAVDLCRSERHVATPPQVTAQRVTGAGDTLMAVHITAELRGESRTNALDQANKAAARFVAGEDI